MNKKYIIVIVFISFLVMGSLFFYISKRVSSEVLGDFGIINEKFQDANSDTDKKIDSLQEKVAAKGADSLNEVEEFNHTVLSLENCISELKKTLLPNGTNTQNFEKLGDVKKSNDVFFLENETYSDTSKEFIAKIEAFENKVMKLQKKYPEIGSKTYQLRTGNQQKDWLVYNFKDFPLIASYTRLTVMENDIKQKKKIVLQAMLNN